MKGKQLVSDLIWGTCIIFLISLPIGNLLHSIRFSLVYTFFIFALFLPLINKIKNLGFIGRFFLANFTGLSYAAIYVVFDVVFKIPLTMTLYFITALFIFIVNLIFYFSEFKLSK